MISALDEQLHSPSTDPSWQESYYFNWADADGRYFGLARIGFNPASGTADGLLITVVDGRLEYVYPAVGVSVTPGELTARAERGLAVDNLCFTMREPLTRWNVTLTGRTSVDLTWTALAAPHDYHPNDGHPDTTHDQPGDVVTETATRTADAHHFEQVGTVTGLIRVGGREHRIDALGQRDKSWGVRDWAAISGWEWITGQFGPDLAFNATLSLVHDSGEPTGFVMRDGVNRALTSVQIDYEWDSTRNVPRSARLNLVDETGEHYEIRATALAQVPMIKGNLFLQETHARFETRVGGVDRVGVGVVEHAWHADRRATLRRLPDLLPVLGKAIVGKVRSR